MILRFRHRGLRRFYTDDDARGLDAGHDGRFFLGVF